MMMMTLVHPVILQVTGNIGIGKRSKEIRTTKEETLSLQVHPLIQMKIKITGPLAKH